MISRCEQEIYLSYKVFRQYLGPTEPPLEQPLTVLSFRVQPHLGCVDLYHHFPMYFRGVYTDKCNVLYFPLPYTILFGVHTSTALAFSLRPITAKVVVRLQFSNARFVVDEVVLAQGS